MLKLFSNKNEAETLNTSISNIGGVGIISSPARRQNLAHLDFGILFVVMSLILIGAMMVYSASISLSDSPKYQSSPEAFFYKHLISLCLALFLGCVVWRVPMKVWQRWAPWLFVVGIGLLVAVFLPVIGKTTNGATRWIRLGFFNLQATEFMKVAVLLYAADFTVRKLYFMHSAKKSFAPMFLVITLVGFLVLEEPDLGAFFMIVVIAMGILFLGGINPKIFIAMIALLATLLVTMIATASWRAARFLAYLNPWDKGNALGKAYQLSHSLIAFGRGELVGVGLGDAIEKQHYLPEAHTDFIMAIIGEELGFLGVVVILLLFFWLVNRAFTIGRNAILLGNSFSGLVAQGVGIWFGVQAIVNVGVATGVFPTKGLTLPFVSFGGSAIMATMAAVALLLRVDYENKITMGGKAI